MNRARVLIVDDDPAIRHLLAATLERYGFEPVPCAEPERAVDLARESGAEAVVLDLMMPGLSGFEVLGMLRRDPLVSHVPVLILSAKTTGSDRVDGLKAGADDYMGKPFDPAELAIRVERLVRGQGRERDIILSGELGGLAAGDILQQVLSSGIDGILHVGGRPPGSVIVHQGQIRGARCGGLEGTSALLVLLERREGLFRFVRTDAGAGEPDERAVSLQGTLMQLAWLEDELERNRQHLPDPTRPLERGEADPPEENECESLGPVLSWFDDHPGGSLADLEEAGILAPAEARLAVALLCGAGVLVPRAEGSGGKGIVQVGEDHGIPERLDQRCAELEAQSVASGRAPGVIHVLLAVAPERWEGFVAEFAAGIPEGVLTRTTAQVTEELRANGSASLRIRCTGRTLLIHAHRLGGLSGLRARAFLTLARFIVFVPGSVPSQGEEEFLKALEQVVRREDAGVVVIPHPEGGVAGLPLPVGARIAERVPDSLDSLLETILG